MRPKVSCFGAGFVGIPTSSVLALHNPNRQVLFNIFEFIVFDINKERIARCQNNDPPIFEPGLEDILKKTNGINLLFSDDIAAALDGTSLIFLALPTPTKHFGQQKGKAYDLSYTQRAICEIVQYYNEHPMLESVILVQKSTVPIGTAEMISNIIDSVSVPENAGKYIVTSNPQFLAEGTAINDLMKPDRIVIGAKEGQDISNLVGLYKFVDPQRIIFTNQYSSELSKLVANCFLAQRVSSINSIAILCEEYESDIKQVRKCIAADTRIGDKFLNSSVGFGGSCFKKDILALIYLAENKGLVQVANYWNAVLEINDYRKKSFFLRVFKSLNYNLKQKKLTIFGVAFKKDTNDPRETPAVEICHYFLEEGAVLDIYDPKVALADFVAEMKAHQLWKEEYSERVSASKAAEAAVSGSHAIIILTEWDIYLSYDYAHFYSLMSKPCHIFDGRNLLDEGKIESIGYKYHRVGKRFHQH